MLGTISRESKDYDQAITYQQEAINLFKKHNDLSGEAQTYLFLAKAMRDKGDKQEARKEIQNAIAIYTSIKTSCNRADAYLELGNTYANREKESNDKIKNYEQCSATVYASRNKLKQADVS